MIFLLQACGRMSALVGCGALAEQPGHVTALVTADLPAGSPANSAVLTRLVKPIRHHLTRPGLARGTVRALSQLSQPHQDACSASEGLLWPGPAGSPGASGGVGGEQHPQRGQGAHRGGRWRLGALGRRFPLEPAVAALPVHDDCTRNALGIHCPRSPRMTCCSLSGPVTARWGASSAAIPLLMRAC